MSARHRVDAPRREGEPATGSPGGPDARAFGATGFVLRLAGVWLLGYLVVAFVPALEDAAIRATLATLVPALRLLLGRVLLVGDSVMAAGASVRIVSECTPLVPGLLLFGAIAVYPASVTRKFVGCVSGGILLWAYNVLRIAALLVVLARYPSFFDLVHVYLWQSVTLLLIAGLFLAWLRWTERGTAA